MVSLDVIKTLIDNQSQVYNGIFETTLKQFMNKISELEHTVMDLKNSLEFSQSEIDKLKKDIINLKEEKQVNDAGISEIKSKQRECVEAVQAAATRCNAIDDHLRRNNVMIDGLPEDGAETSEITMLKVQDTLKEKMELPDVLLETAYRVGPRREDRPRTVLARFKRFTDREAAMRNTRKLSGTKIYFNDDLCPASQQLKSSQMPALRAARAEGKIAFFVGTRLIIKEQTRPQESRTPAYTNEERETGASVGTDRVTRLSSRQGNLGNSSS